MNNLNDISPSFCLLPWIHTMYSTGGDYKPCCNSDKRFSHLEVGKTSLKEAFDSPELKQLREQLLDGKKPDICSTCWKQEENGIKSYRQSYLEKYQHLLETDLTPKLKYLDIKIDNHCNLQCRMCDPISSNKVANTVENLLTSNQKIPEHFIAKITKYEKETTRLWPYKDFHQSKKTSDVIEVLDKLQLIKITGGEPFQSKDVLHILDQAIEQGHAKNIKVVLTTNGTKFYRPILERIKLFMSAEFNISVDGTEAIYDYIRYPFSWKQWIDRVDEFLNYIDEFELWRNNKFLVRTSTIVSIYNWLNLSELYLYLENYEKKFPWLKEIHFLDRCDFNLDLRPTHSELHIKNLPKNLLRQGLNALKENAPNMKQLKDIESDIEKILSTTDINREKQQQLKYFTEILDKERNQDFRKVLPTELIQWMNEIPSEDLHQLQNGNYWMELNKIKLS